MAEELPVPHPPMTPDELLRVGRLSDEAVEQIDDALASSVTEQFHKAARVVGIAIEQTPWSDVPDHFYFLRLLELVDRGLIELAGYRHNMRFCEVRIAHRPSPR